jgi:hypothetical protein
VEIHAVFLAGRRMSEFSMGFVLINTQNDEKDPLPQSAEKPAGKKR